jgi:hypothetical protein
MLRDRIADITWWMASRPDVVNAVGKNDISSLQKISREIMARSRVSSITIVNTNGAVIAQGHTPETEESPGKFQVVQQALNGKPAAGLEEDPSFELVLRAACPVKSDRNVIGAVTVGMNLFSDHSFVDGIIKNFGLVCSVFHNDTRISTTIFKEGKRAIGTKLNNEKIHNEVLINGGICEGRNKVVDKEYDAIYWPLRNVNGKIVGVMGIGKDRETLTRVFSIIALLVVLIAVFAGILTTRKSFRLRSLILLVIIPALVLIIGIAGWLLYRNMYSIILEGFNEKLFALSTTTASCLDGDRIKGVLDKRNSEHPDYLAYMKTLREIQKQKDVTYLYTFVLGGKKDIVYIIDASPGEDFCPIGYEENVPMQNLEGLHRTINEGIPYISDIMEYERYGLLKVSAAPIHGSTNNIQALCGVDINISIIKHKLRMAISDVMGVGAIALFLAGLVSLWVSRKLIEPLTKVKSGALLLAAGEYGRRITVSEPQELEVLASAFNKVGNTIGGILQKAAENNEKNEAARRLTELAKELADISKDSPTDKAYHLALRWLGGRIDCANASGAIANEKFVFAWVTDSSTDSLQALKMRRDIAVIGSRLLKTHANDKASIISTLRFLFKDIVHAFFLFDSNTGMVHQIVRHPARGILIDSSGNLSEIILSDDKNITIQTGTALALISPITIESFSAIIRQKQLPGVGKDFTSKVIAIESVMRSLTHDIQMSSNGLLVVFERRIST